MAVLHFTYGEEGKNVLAQNMERSGCRPLLISILQMLSNIFFAMCSIIIHPHLNRPSQFLHSAMPIAPGGRFYSDCWMKSDRIVSKLSFISKGRV